jgi:hypothetical protein
MKDQDIGKHNVKLNITDAHEESTEYQITVIVTKPELFDGGEVLYELLKE